MRSHFVNMPPKVQASLSQEGWKVYCKDAPEQEGDAELLIMDVIGKDFMGEGVGAKDVSTFLANNKGRGVNVRINSPGGLVYDGLQIYNGLANHDGQVTVTIEGLAYSAASFIAMAGDTIRMHEASDLGIHRAWGIAIGNSKTMDSESEWLRTIDNHLVDIYTERTGKDADTINQWMDGTDDGTLFSAKQAVEHGFADEIIPLKAKPKKDSKAARAEIASRRIAAEHSIRLARIRQMQQSRQ